MRPVDAAGKSYVYVEGFRCTVGECRLWAPARAWLDVGACGLEPGQREGTCPRCMTYHDETQMKAEGQWVREEAIVDARAVSR